MALWSLGLGPCPLGITAEPFAADTAHDLLAAASEIDLPTAPPADFLPRREGDSDLDFRASRRAPQTSFYRALKPHPIPIFLPLIPVTHGPFP